MIFNTFAYFALFLVPAAIVFRLVRPAFQPWTCLLFGAGFFVYFSLTQVGGAPGAFCLAIFIWESIFSRFYRPRSWICLVGIAQTILFLVIFKYWNFFTGLVCAPLGRNPLFWRGAFLPLGISFFTFEFIHYAVDRYRGTAPRGKFGEYLAFILFFPTMVAGPIKRYQDFRPKLIHPSLAWETDWRQGITRILAGLAKKFAVADLLTALTDHLNHADIAKAARWVLPIWLLAYGMKIYADFSAYSDIAIGSARLFGLRVPENFDWPYLRTNIAQFWKHWHMSLYRWLVDYVFIPLGGSRTSPPRVYVNVLITMLLSGLWHGAGLNFVVWGLWHGMLLCAYRLWSNWRQTPLASATVPGPALITVAGLRMTGLEPVGPPRPLPVPAACPQLCAAGEVAETRTVRRPNAQVTEEAGWDNPKHQVFSEHRQVPGEGPVSWCAKLAAWGLTFVLVNLGWAFFCMDLPTSLFFFRRLFLG
ncbi:Putative poly(Beta-D-mannuronate) O-acetylase (modular protein) [Verrucomicrobia bacterium]|nr:Putative poly(Beta-D-mannuronate) O-acetylase (modular protein) [Verrucomicrobiota bacterium]